MNIIEKINSGVLPLITVVGTGYVGMPLIEQFSKICPVIAYDINKKKIEKLSKNKNKNIRFTSDAVSLKMSDVIIVCVPTPIDSYNNPNLEYIKLACTTIAENIKMGALIIFESSYMPTCTEKLCIPLIEKVSGLENNKDFFVGYSPERINPGDNKNTLNTITKLIATSNDQILNAMEFIYSKMAGINVYKINDIKVAEMSKLVENCQRDINIAFMNELAMVFDRMGIDTNEVVDGMNTKWNALGFRPGLVGGHCIGVDPYYFTYEAEKLGYHSQIILNGRIVNDSMGRFVADAAIKQMIEVGQAPKNSKVVILGLTFKENCPDTRNSKVDDIIKRLNEYGIQPVVVDPWASERDAMREYGVKLTHLEDVKDADCVIVAVAHKEFRAISLDDMKMLYKSCDDAEKVLLDVKGIYKIDQLKKSGMKYWRL